jgi:hypothetical protein
VMKLHRLSVDVRFKRGVVVGKWWQFVSQNILLGTSSPGSGRGAG